MSDNHKIAYRDSAFLESDDGRPLRILAEYLKPMAALEASGIRDTVVFFGSARLSETGEHARYYRAARTLAHDFTRWASHLPGTAQRFIVCTGGGGGVMEAANRGAHEAGGRTMGLNIGLPHEQRRNPYISEGLGFEFRYFFMRKLWFAHLARAVVVFPGGFGTLDELFEILTLRQTRKLGRPITVLLYGSEYWREIVNFKALARHGMIAESDLSLFHVVDHTDQALSILKTTLRAHIEEGAPSLAPSIWQEESENGEGPEG